MRISQWLCGMVLIVHVAACGGREASRYTGSVMDDSAADSASTLSLTLWPASDSIYDGFVRVAQPVGRGGRMSAWYVGTTFKLYSVSADGDTIVWTSPQSGATIGGTYEVVGGVFSGHGGTWRARLASGPPASREVLDRAARRHIPPFDAIWPGLVFVALIALCARWIRRAPIPVPDAVSDPLGVVDRSVGGWMAFFMFGQIVSVAILAFKVPELGDFLENGAWDLGAVIMGARGILVVEKLVTLSRLGAPLLGIWLVVKRSRYAPRFWMAYLVLLAVYLLLDHFAAGWIHGQNEALTGPVRTDDFNEARQEQTFTALRTPVILLLWSMYWCNSTRVRARFGYAALDKPDASAPRSDVALAGSG